eukprot:scaffold187_cov329-Pavlova_lutheri.AAC.17
MQLPSIHFTRKQWRSRIRHTMNSLFKRAGDAKKRFVELATWIIGASSPYHETPCHEVEEPSSDNRDDLEEDGSVALVNAPRIIQFLHYCAWIIRKKEQPNLQLIECPLEKKLQSMVAHYHHSFHPSRWLLHTDCNESRKLLVLQSQVHTRIGSNADLVWTIGNPWTDARERVVIKVKARKEEALDDPV